MGYIARADILRAMRRSHESTDCPAEDRPSELSHAAGYAVETAINAAVPRETEKPPIHADVPQDAAEMERVRFDKPAFRDYT